MALKMIDGVFVPEKFELPPRPDPAQQRQDAELFAEALELIRERKALLLAHYYTSETMQKLCEASGGFIGDSLELARMGSESPSALIILAGVRFMGETAKILSPDKRVVMPSLKAECSLDLCCQAEDLARVKSAHPEAVVVAYANTSAAVKAQSDWIVTSSLAVELGKYLSKSGRDIIWVPDRHLGSYIASLSGADLWCWPGRCIVHDAFEANALKFVMQEHPQAKVLVHPEASEEVVKLAHFVGSTSQILNFAKTDGGKEFIIATERNIFYKISQACPEVKLIEAPVASRSGYCISCANCPWMELNTLAGLIAALKEPEGHEVFVDEEVRVKALPPLKRMLEFSADLKAGRIVV
ncbi:MAG: quinolinate synthase NadA [Succinivibrio sp.]|nr:quinolinate synthase NadA [Succinivibrio sp.]